MVKSEKIYSPQNYLEMVTHQGFIINSDDDVAFIECILKREGYNNQSYSLSNIDFIVEHNIDVVLVDCLVYNDNTHEFGHCYRWFEVPSKKHKSKTNN